MEKMFKVGDKVTCPSIDVLTKVHDEYWPRDINRDAYLKDLEKLVGNVYTIDNVYKLGNMYVVYLKEDDSPINRWKKPQELFELYYKHIDDENIPIIFGMTNYWEQQL